MQGQGALRVKGQGQGQKLLHLFKTQIKCNYPSPKKMCISDQIYQKIVGGVTGKEEEGEGANPAQMASEPPNLPIQPPQPSPGTLNPS